MTNVDRLHRHLEERARIATVAATPITSIVRRAKQRDRRRRAAIGGLGVAVVGGLAIGALWMGGSVDTFPSTTIAPALPANGWVAEQFGNEIWLVRPGEESRPVEFGNAEACPAFSPDG